jgi:hypothetical protein
MNNEQRVNGKYLVRPKKNPTEMKRQSMHFSTENGKSEKNRVAGEGNNIIFFDITRVLMTDWVPEGQAVKENCYMEVLTKL